MKVSVVTVTYNRSIQARRGLISLLNQTHPPEEIIFIDEGSDRETEQLGVELKSISKNNFTYFKTFNESPRISCVARNIGWKIANGDWIVFTEPECLHVGDTIDQLRQKIEESPEMSHLATQVWTMGQRIYNKLDDEYYSHPARILNHPYAQLTDSPNTTNTKAPDSDWGITGQSNISAGCLFAVKKDWLEAIGGFDESFEGHGWDDFDLYARLAIYGHGILGHPDIAVIHQWHEKNYPYNIYDTAERNGKISESNVHKGIYKVN